LDSEDMVTFFKDKDTEKTIKDYEYLLNEKQSHLIFMSSFWILLVNVQR